MLVQKRLMLQFLEAGRYIRESARHAVSEMPKLFLWVVMHSCGISSATV